jgi:ATP-dependent Clp protease ATP-binding subunit ClpA
MLEGYTVEAKLSVLFANEARKSGSSLVEHPDKARLSGSTVIESEHLLLGLARENPTLIDRFLVSKIPTLTPSSEAPAQAVSSEDTSRDIPELQFSDECRRIFSFAGEEADTMGGQKVGAEHLLLGILREESCFAARMLREHGASIERVRGELTSAPHQIPTERERALRAFDGILKTLGDRHPRASAKIAKMKERLQNPKNPSGPTNKDDR